MFGIAITFYDLFSANHLEPEYCQMGRTELC